MVPMVSTAKELDLVRALVEKEKRLLGRKGQDAPKRIKLGAMLEVPSLLFELDEVMRRVDFISVGSNDLMQFLFAADRTNARVGSRFDVLAPAPLRALRTLVRSARRHRVPVTLCGEMAGRPLEAMALIGLGFRSLSMAAASIGPVKAMILSLDAGKLQRLLDGLLKEGADTIRADLKRFAEKSHVSI
jgi:phosphotransferase system enzyme I (PtsP)